MLMNALLLVFAMLIFAPVRGRSKCRHHDEIKAAKCGAILADIRFDFDLQEFPDWENACNDYANYQLCAAKVPDYCLGNIMPNVQKLWTALCAQKSLLKDLAEQNDCLNLIKLNNKLQQCFRQHAINANNTLDELCPVVENRYHCFTRFEMLDKCRIAAKAYQIFYDILMQNLAKSSEESFLTTTEPIMTNEITRIDSKNEKTRAIPLTATAKIMSTTATMATTTNMETSKVVTKQQNSKSDTFKSTSKTKSINATPKSVEIAKVKRSQRTTEQDIKQLDLKCSYRSIDEMIRTYQEEKEQSALGGCFQIDANGGVNADLTGLIIQPHVSGKNGSGTICGCISGYHINKTSRKCVDTDECMMESHLCSHICTNYKGGYYCTCQSIYGEIYSLSTKNNRTCARDKQETDSTWLLFAHGQSIWNVSDDGRYVELKISGLEKAAMIDVDVKNHAVYFVDSGKGLLEKFALSNKTAKPETVQNYEMDGVEGIAIDYISGNLYSARRSDIFVQALFSNVKRRMRLYTNKLSTPRALVAHAPAGWLFGSDWSSEAFLYRAAMDGSHFRKIITSDVIWPNGLAVDHYASRLYWADAFLDVIESTDFNGGHRRAIIAKSGALVHPFGLAVADDFIYWTDWNHRGILRADKLTGHNVTLLAQTTLLPYGIKVFHSSVQPIVKNEVNPCDKLKCDHLCLRQPNNLSSPSHHGAGAVCACSSGYLLDDDNRTCRADCREPVQNVIICGGSEPRCVSKRYVCDGIIHCPDHMDEQNCPERVCPLGEFQCVDEPTNCLDASAVCDGRKNCRDASDERYCELRKISQS